jgi:hypothetical protein
VGNRVSRYNNRFQFRIVANLNPRLASLDVKPCQRA